MHPYPDARHAAPTGRRTGAPDASSPYSAGPIAKRLGGSNTDVPASQRLLLAFEA